MKKQTITLFALSFFAINIAGAQTTEKKQTNEPQKTVLKEQIQNTNPVKKEQLQKNSISHLGKNEIEKNESPIENKTLDINEKEKTDINKDNENIKTDKNEKVDKKINQKEEKVIIVEEEIKIEKLKKVESEKINL